MPIIVCGINHKTAPVELREKVLFTREKVSLYLNDLLAHENAREAVLLSTCNRSELYCDSDDSWNVMEWFCRQHQVPPAELESAIYLYRDAEAVEHIMQVACGLDSMVLGESQILGQMKDAFSESCAAGAVGTLFNRLFQYVFAVAKEVRTNTSIGACPVSVSSAAANFIKQYFPVSLSNSRLLLIGAGVTIELVLRHLQSHSFEQVTIANRSPDAALDLAKKYGAESIGFADLSKALVDADIVVSATGSVMPVVTHSMLAHRVKPIFMVDIAVPRDIEPSVADIDLVQLYSIDDLKPAIQQNLRGREHAAEKARAVILERSQDFMSWLTSLDRVATTIRAYRKQIEALSDAELTKSLRQLQRGDDPSHVLTQFAYALTQKLLHTPTVQMRQAGVEGRLELLQLAAELFAIPEVEFT